MTRLALLLSALVAFPACGPASPPEADGPTREAAPRVTLPTADGPVDLAELEGCDETGADVAQEYKVCPR